MAQTRNVRWRNWFARQGYVIDLWNVYTNKIGTESLTINCWERDNPFASHEFYF